MARRNQGAVNQRKDGLFYGRVRWTDDDTGKPREKKFPGQATDSEAWRLVHKFKDELAAEGSKAISNDSRTFEELADEYESNYLTEAEYVRGIKVSGLRSLAAPKGQLKILREFFKRKKLRSLTYTDVRRFRETRLKTPTRREVDEDGNPVGQRSIASVNRELALLRRMLNVAYRELRWIPRNPFQDGKTLISNAEERKRERILSREEEQKLLDQCTGRRKHLRAFIICAIDTGCRKGELLKMRWREIDLEARELSIPMMNTKTAKQRIVPVSNRMLVELELLWNESDQNPDALVFGVKDVKRSFDGARSDAGIPDVRVHDLRHSYASRLAKNHMPVAEIARILGHATLEMSYRYINSDKETLERAKSIVNEFHAESAPSASVETEMVN
ncbi:MAG TPA: site-specific integrase [Pyrinomonadaceae bacterium]|jgi:integrase